MFVIKVDEQMNVIIEAEYTQKDGPEIILNIAPDITGKMLGGMGSAMAYIGFGFVGLIVIAVTLLMQIKARKSISNNMSRMH